VSDFLAVGLFREMPTVQKACRGYKLPDFLHIESVSERETCYTKHPVQQVSHP
jgi:hypothetical protein